MFLSKIKSKKPPFLISRGSHHKYSKQTPHLKTPVQSAIQQSHTSIPQDTLNHRVEAWLKQIPPDTESPPANRF